MDFLLFRLYGPIASWGEIAIGESRHTASYPSKSAIIGLMAAALGIKRTDTEKQSLMQQEYAFGVEVYSTGSLLRDYHTAQAPDSVGSFNYRTRRDELFLGKARLGTILSSREYRMDALALVAVKASPDAPYDLRTIEKYLTKPKFHLYLGRKSCPLSVPLDPQIAEGKTCFYDAFKAYKHKPIMPANNAGGHDLFALDAYWLSTSKERYYYWEGTGPDFSDKLNLSRMQTRVRNDQPLSRKRWQFIPRQEHYLYMLGGE